MKFNKVFFIGLNKTGTYSIYKYLIENSANINDVTSDYWTPLCVVCRFSANFEIIKYLVNFLIKHRLKNMFG